MIWVAIKSSEPPRSHRGFRCDNSTDMSEGEILNFHLFCITPKQGKTSTQTHRVDCHQPSKPSLLRTCCNLMLFDFCLHKKQKSGFLFLYHLAKVPNCPRVPKPPAVPTYKTHNDWRGCSTASAKLENPKCSLCICRPLSVSILPLPLHPLDPY
jgi:hypothetical protein